MKFTRDTIRTILALLLVIIIVVATFAYGNAQRNRQQVDNKVKVTETQTKTNENEKSATVATPIPVTAPTPAPATPDATPATGGSAQVQPATMPETGAEAAYVVPLTIVALAVYFYLRSRQRLVYS